METTLTTRSEHGAYSAAAKYFVAWLLSSTHLYQCKRMRLTKNRNTVWNQLAVFLPVTVREWEGTGHFKANAIQFWFPFTQAAGPNCSWLHLLWFAKCLCYSPHTTPMLLVYPYIINLVPRPQKKNQEKGHLAKILVCGKSITKYLFPACEDY